MWTLGSFSKLGLFSKQKRKNSFETVHFGRGEALLLKQIQIIGSFSTNSAVFFLGLTTKKSVCHPLPRHTQKSHSSIQEQYYSPQKQAHQRLERIQTPSPSHRPISSIYHKNQQHTTFSSTSSVTPSKGDLTPSPDRFYSSDMKKQEWVYFLLQMRRQDPLESPHKCIE